MTPAIQLKNELEYSLSDSEFGELRELVYKMTGISLSSEKRDLVLSRYRKRLRTTGLENFADYISLVRSNPDIEGEQFANAITTNLTSFFREAHHFDQLASTVLPELRRRRDRRVRVWSAGCSTGEEPYSIAITILENWPSIAGRDLKILATDIDSEVVAKTRAAAYDARRIEGLKAGIQRRWFKEHSDIQGQRAVTVHAKAQAMVHCKQLNLMDHWPMTGPFQVIFCRNTVIYFDKDTQRALFDRFADLQNVGDYLFIGHSESLTRVTERYKLVSSTMYRKIR